MRLLSGILGQCIPHWPNMPLNHTQTLDQNLITEERPISCSGLFKTVDDDDDRRYIIICVCVWICTF